MSTQSISRRQFLRFSALTGGALALAACGAREQQAEIVTRTNDDVLLVGDVQQYALATDDWEADFGWVRLRLHEARYNGEPVYYIRTDSSDAAHASANKMVHVPILSAGAAFANRLYMLGGDQPPVMRAIPGDEIYSPLFQLVAVDGGGTFASEVEILEAELSGAVTLRPQQIFVNHPLVKWPGGELPADDERTAALGKGPLIDPPDLQRMEVTFKLHKCYPGSRYIVTDTSAVPMAGMMGIIGSGPTQALIDAGGTDEIWVFGNGLPGPGVMGFQPAVFDNQAGTPAWSPFWNHFVVLWADESNARLITNSAEIRALVQSGELEQFAGTPDTHPNGFVVNCPAPILSPNDYRAPVG